MQITHKTKGWERAGYVLYWVSILVGLMLAAFFVVAAPALGLGLRIGLSAAIFLACYLGARAFRFLLTGR
jgi:hypothetical protein